MSNLNKLGSSGVDELGRDSTLVASTNGDVIVALLKDLVETQKGMLKLLEAAYGDGLSSGIGEEF